MILKADLGILDVMPKLQPVNFGTDEMSSKVFGGRRLSRERADLAVLTVAKRGSRIIWRVKRDFVGNGTAITGSSRQHPGKIRGS